MNELKIHVGADISELITELSKATDISEKFAKSVSSGIDTKVFDELNLKLKNFGKNLDEVGLKMKNLSRPTTDATMAMDDFSKKLSTAGIQVKDVAKPITGASIAMGSFATTGKAALRTILTSLSRLAGVGLAFSLLGSAMGSTNSGIINWIKNIGRAKKEGDGLKTILGQTREQIEVINKKFVDESSRVTQLVTAMQSGKLSHEQIKSAKQELIRISPTYFKNLDVESGKISEVTAAYNKYNNSLIKTIENQLKTDKLTKSISDRFLVEETNPLGLKEFQKLLNEGKSLDDILRTIGEQTMSDIKSEIQETSGLYSNIGKEAQLAYSQQVKAENKTKAANKELLIQLNNVATAYKAVQDVAGTIDPELVKIVPKDLKKQVEEVKRVWKLQRVEIPAVFSNTDGIFSLEGYRNFKKKAEDMMKKHPLYLEAPQIKISPFGDWSDKLSQQAKAKMKELEAMKKMAEDVTMVVGTQLAGAFDSVFRTIAEEGTISMKQVGNAIKQLIIELTSAAIRAAILAAVMKLMDKGGTMGSFGSMFKGFMGVGMATGGIVPPGYPNDSYPARLTSGEVVIPPDRIDSIMGDMGGGRLVATVSGSDLKFILDRTNRSQGRSF